MNNWKTIRAFYKHHESDILGEREYEWAIDPYEWRNVPGMIQLTKIESWFWSDIRLMGAVLYPQYPVGPYFVDFANPVAKVAVECDGAAYHIDKAKDRERDVKLQDMGWAVYRISGSDCRTDFIDETGESGTAYRFLKRICEDHGISRRFQPYKEDFVDIWSAVMAGFQGIIERKPFRG